MKKVCNLAVFWLFRRKSLAVSGRKICEVGKKKIKLKIRLPQTCYEANTSIYRPLFHIYRARWGYIMGCSSLTDGFRVLAPKAGMDQWALGYRNPPEVDCFWQEVSCCWPFLAGFSSFSGIDWAILPCNFVSDSLRVSGIDQCTVM